LKTAKSEKGDIASVSCRCYANNLQVVLTFIPPHGELEVIKMRGLQQNKKRNTNYCDRQPDTDTYWKSQIIRLDWSDERDLIRT